MIVASSLCIFNFFNLDFNSRSQGHEKVKSFAPVFLQISHLILMEAGMLYELVGRVKAILIGIQFCLVMFMGRTVIGYFM